MSPDYLSSSRLLARPHLPFALVLALGLGVVSAGLAALAASAGRSAPRHQLPDTPVAQAAAAAPGPLLIRVLLALPALPAP